MGELLAVTCDSCGEPMVPSLARLVDHYVDAEEARGREADAPAGRAGRAQADLARLGALVLELGRPAAS
jgi:hypothetical protein